MSKFEYSFDMNATPDGFQLTFHDFKDGTFTAPTRDALTKMAQEFLDDKIYELLKNKKTVPMPSRRTSHDKKMAPSEALVLALEFYINPEK